MLNVMKFKLQVCLNDRVPVCVRSEEKRENHLTFADMSMVFFRMYYFFIKALHIFSIILRTMGLHVRKNKFFFMDATPNMCEFGLACAVCVSECPSVCV